MSEVFNSSVLEAINRATIYNSDYVDPSTLKVIVIDGETRNMTIPEGENLFGARGDKNVERKYFQCPKIVGDNIDLSQHLIYVNYVFTDIDSTTNLPETKIGMYHCEDVAVEGDNITFSWLLSGNVLHNPGFIAFKVCAKEKESDPTTVFNTTPAIGIVLYTIPDGSEIIPEEYPDIITQLLADMDATKEEVAAQIARIDAIKDQIEGAVEGTLINDNTESNIFTYSSQKINTELRKKATYYDSVASMKADSSLKDSSIAVTLGYYSENDGGGATYLIRSKQSGDEDDGGSIHELNGGQLVAELIIEEYVTPEMFGAVGDRVHDDTEAIQTALTSGKKVILTNKYLISSTLLIDSNTVVFIYGELKYTGNYYAILVFGNYNNLYVRRLTSSGKGIGIESSSLVVCYNKITVDFINSEQDCIVFESKDNGVVYNVLNFVRILSNEGNCISFKSSSLSSSYVGENTIIGGRCEKGNWAIYASSDRSGGIPAIKAYNVCMEGVSNGIYLNNVYSSIFSYFRYAEAQDKEDAIILEVSGNSIDNVFEGSYALRSDKIKWDNYTVQLSIGHPMRLNCPIITKRGVVIGKGAVISPEGLVITPITYYKYYNVMSTPFIITFDVPQYSYFLANADNGELHLNSSYGSIGISEIIIQQTSSNARRTKVFDVNDKLIFDGTTKELGIYRLTCVSKANEDVWYSEKITLEQ